MERLLLFASLFVIAVLGVGIALCAFHILSAKTKRLSIWKMPRARLFALSCVAAVATVVAQKGVLGVRYVDQNASVSGSGTSWGSPARTIDEVSREMRGGVIYVKPGVYGAFSYHEPPIDGEPLKVVAMGSPEETVIDGGGTTAIQSLEAEQPHVPAPFPENPTLRLEGFTVRNMNVRACDQAFDRCIISNYTQGVAFAGWFRNCLIVGNESTAPASLFDGCIFDNCTVTGNRTTSNSAVNSVARNSIFWDNFNSPFYCLYATNCCVEGGAWAGANNLAEDPLFVNSDKGNFSLAEGSPCIDAGDDAVAAGERDLAGSARVKNDHVDIGAYEHSPSPFTARLVYRNTLDSVDAVEHPVIGPPGTCSNATFVAGKFGSALYVPAGTCAAAIPLPMGLPAERGCVEFWARLEGSNETFGRNGDPMFLYVCSSSNSSCVATIDISAQVLPTKGGPGAFLFNHSMYPYRDPPVRSYAGFLSEDGVKDWHHYSLVWNVNGISSLSPYVVMAVYLDGTKMGHCPINTGWNQDEFMATLSQPLTICLSYPNAEKGQSPYSIDELRIWDSDKTVFYTRYPRDAAYNYDGKGHTILPPLEEDGTERFRYSLSQGGPFVKELPAVTNAGMMCVWYEATIPGEGTLTNVATVTVNKCPLTFKSPSKTKRYDGTPLLGPDVRVTGDVPTGEGFSFVVTGSQTVVGTSGNVFTWMPQEGTNPDNYDVTVVYGKLKVTMEELDAGTEYEIVSGETDTVRITCLPCPDGGDVTLPSTLGGLPVEITAGALTGTSVTGVRVPSGVVVSGALFENLPNVTNVTLDAGCAVTGALSCRGSAALQEVVVPASVAELAPHAFLDCWALERVVFAGEPPFGNNTEATSELALLTASVRPATLLQMADMICYPAACAAKWEKSLRNFGYGGKYGAYEGEWTGLDSLVADSGNLNKDPGGPASPTEQPAAHYAAQTGVASGTVMPGAAGWDAFGVPDGMTWDKETGTLSGTPKRSGTYDVILVSGSGADTKMMRTTVDVAGYAVTTGYVGVAFKVSGAPWNALASYKAAPKGLKWKNKVLSGVPKKVGTTTYKTKDGEPVKVAILALPVGAKGTFNGVLQDGAGKQYPLKVAASAAGKLTATVTKGTKAYSLSAARWSKVTLESVDGAPHRMFAATLTASGLSLSVKVDADAAWNADALTAAGTQGAVKNLTGTAQRNAYASDAAAQEAAAARAGTYALTATADAGGWTLALPEAGATGALTVVVKATGATTLTGTLPNKAKVSASSTLHVDTEGTSTVRFYVSGKWITWHPL